MLQYFSDAPNQKYSLPVISHRLSICFVVTTPFAVNAFLINHLNTDSKNIFFMNTLGAASIFSFNEKYLKNKQRDKHREINEKKKCH